MEEQGVEKDNTISGGKQPGNGAALPSAEGQAAVFVIFAVLRREGPASQSEPDATPPAPGTQSPGAAEPGVCIASCVAGTTVLPSSSRRPGRTAA